MEHKKKSRIIAQIIADFITQSVIDNKAFLAEKALQKIINNNIDIEYAYIVGINNKIFAHAFKDNIPEDFKNMIYEKDHTNGSYLSNSAILKQPVFDISYPLANGIPGYIHIGVNKIQSYSQVVKLGYRILITTFFVVFIGVLVGSFFTRHIIKPITQLSKVMYSFGNGKKEEDITSIGGCREVVDLTAAFNHMISKQTKTMESLQKSEGKYRVLVENQTDMIVKLDINMRILFVSPSFCKTFGKTHDELVGENFMFPIHHEDLKIAKKAMNDVLKPPYFVKVEERIMTKDGWCWQEWHKTGLLDKNGKVMMIMSVGRNINKRKQAELELIKSENRYQYLFDSMSDLFYTKDMEGRFLSVNPALEKLFGYKKKELIGHKSTEFLIPELVSDFEAEYIKQLKATRYHEGIATYFAKNGDTITIEHHSSVVNPDNSEPFITGMGRDITEKVLWEKKVNKLQKQLTQAQKMESIGTLAGGIAHDFNNILSPIFGYLEIMLCDIHRDNPLHDYLTEVFNGATRAKDLVKQILTFSRQNEQELKPLKIQFAVKEALKLIKSSLPSTINVTQHIKKDYGLVLANSTQIHQIIMNLCTNAYYAMGEKEGTLTVSLEELKLSDSDLKSQVMVAGNYICLKVTDTGIGIKKSIIDRIFDPYFTTKEKDRGTGLGLAVIHGIVKTHGGYIKVYSEHGKGAEFQVFLPVIKKQIDKIKNEAYLPVQKGDERILLIDDQKIVVDIEKEMLERLGYHVTALTVSADALNIFRDNPYDFDLVITDMTMPDMTGDKLSKELIKIRPDIPVIICTGFSEIISEEKAELIGTKGFLMKPVTMKDLSNTICKVLNKN